MVLTLSDGKLLLEILEGKELVGSVGCLVAPAVAALNLAGTGLESRASRC